MAPSHPFHNDIPREITTRVEWGSPLILLHASSCLVLNPVEGEILKPNSSKQTGFFLWKMLCWTFWSQNGILRKNAHKMP
jgi:hypothetical protein